MVSTSSAGKLLSIPMVVLLLAGTAPLAAADLPTVKVENETGICLNLPNNTATLVTVGHDRADGITFYVEIRDNAKEGIWLYQESNHLAGLQRGGVSKLGDAEICDDGSTQGPDILIY